MNMYCLTFLFTGILLSVEVDSLDIHTKITQYFGSDIFRSFEHIWQKHKKSYDNAVLLALKENYGYKPMNVYVRRMRDIYKISKGFYVSDNIVDLLLLNLDLQALPYIKMMDVSISLACNVIQVEASLSKMFVDADYLLFRNQSEVLYQGMPQDPYRYSPFSFQQVHNVGKLAIIAEDCNLVGTAIASLSGESVNLGQNTFRITDCKFSVEISPPGSRSPPVIAPYFSKEQGVQLQQLLVSPVREELMPKLQAAMYSYINTTVIFGTDLVKFRQNQQKIFKVTSDYMREVVSKLNKFTIQKNQGGVRLEKLKMYLNETYNGKAFYTYFLIANVTLNGLDTAYSAHVGGPYKLKTVKISEAIRFSTLQVRGTLNFENETTNGQYDFAVEMLDVAVEVTIDMQAKSFKDKYNFKVMGWRTMEFSIIESGLFIKERITYHSIITGHLINEIPKTIVNHLSDMFINDMTGTENIREDDDKNVPYETDDIPSDNETITGVTYGHSEETEESNNKWFENQDKEINENKQIVNKHIKNLNKPEELTESEDISSKKSKGKYYGSKELSKNVDEGVVGDKGLFSDEGEKGLFSDNVFSDDYKGNVDFRNEGTNIDLNKSKGTVLNDIKNGEKLLHNNEDNKAAFSKGLINKSSNNKLLDNQENKSSKSQQAFEKDSENEDLSYQNENLKDDKYITGKPFFSSEEGKGFFSDNENDKHVFSKELADKILSDEKSEKESISDNTEDESNNSKDFISNAHSNIIKDTTASFLLEGIISDNNDSSIFTEDISIPDPVFDYKNDKDIILDIFNGDNKSSGKYIGRNLVKKKLSAKHTGLKRESFIRNGNMKRDAILNGSSTDSIHRVNRTKKKSLINNVHGDKPSQKINTKSNGKNRIRTHSKSKRRNIISQSEREDSIVNRKNGQRFRRNEVHTSDNEVI